MSHTIRHPPNCAPSPSTSSNSSSSSRGRTKGGVRVGTETPKTVQEDSRLRRTIGTSPTRRHRTPAISSKFGRQGTSSPSPTRQRSTTLSRSRQLEENVTLIRKLQKQQNVVPIANVTKLVPRNRTQASPTKSNLHVPKPKRRLAASELGKIEIANVSRVEIGKSNKKNKRLDAKFHFLVSPYPTGKMHLVVSFGSSHGRPFLDHGAETLKQDYIKKHEKTQNWDDPFTAGALARYLLYGETTLQASIAKFQQRFGFRQVVQVFI